MKRFKKAFLLTAVVLTVLLCFVFSASALDETGKCGENVYWFYNAETETLTISGTGPMDDYYVFEPGYDDWSGEYFDGDPYSSSPFFGAKIKNVTVKNGVTSIGVGSFYANKELTEISLPESLLSIGNKAFYKSGLVSISIPAGVKTIGKIALACDNLKSIYVDENNQYYSSSKDGILFNKDKSELILCPPDYLEIEYIVPDSVTDIKGDAFYNNANLISITIPVSVTEIEDSAFSCFEYLVDVYYCGTEEQWLALNYTDYEETWNKINIHYNYICNYDCTHTNRINYSQLDSTCAEYGFTAGVYCPDCAKWIEGHKRIPLSKSHPNAEKRFGQKPTCTTRGYMQGTYCPDCDRWLNGHQWINPTGHSFTEKIIDADHLVSEATANKPAVYRFECANESCNVLSEDKTFTYNGVIGRTSKITTVCFPTQISLSWAEVSPAAGYKIYQKTPTGWEKLGTVTQTHCAIKKLAPGTEYSFAVKAGSIIDGKVVWSDTYTAITTATQSPAPSEVTSAQNTSAFKISWKACVGATGYRIYYVDANRQVKIAVSSTTATSHTFKNLKAGAKYTLYIRPYKIVSDGTVVWSEYTIFTTATKPATVTAKPASPSKGKLTLTWNKVDGNIDGYRVYYKTGNGAYKIYKNYATPQNLTFSNLKSGTKYTFAVRAGIKTSGGIVWSGYTEVPVTVK